MSDIDKERCEAVAGSYREMLADLFPWARVEVEVKATPYLGRGADHEVHGSVMHGQRKTYFVVVPHDVPNGRDLIERMRIMLERPAGPVALCDVSVGDRVGASTVVLVDRAKRVVGLRAPEGTELTVPVTDLVRGDDGSVRLLWVGHRA